MTNPNIQQCECPYEGGCLHCANNLHDEHCWTALVEEVEKKPYRFYRVRVKAAPIERTEDYDNLPYNQNKDEIVVSRVGTHEPIPVICPTGCPPEDNNAGNTQATRVQVTHENISLCRKEVVKEILEILEFNKDCFKDSYIYAKRYKLIIAKVKKNYKA